MKVAVISSLGHQQGSSSLVTLLATTFAHTQRKKAAILANHDLSVDFNTIETGEDNTSNNSVTVLRALIASEDFKGDNILDYGVRYGAEDVFAFNTYAEAETHEAQVKLFWSVWDKLNTDLVLIDIAGDVSNISRNKELEAILNRCDAILMVYDTSIKSINAVKKYIDSAKTIFIRKTGFVCQKYDENCMSEKKLANLIGVNAAAAMSLPYNPIIQSESIDGTLNTLARFIALGYSEVINLRHHLCEIMQFLFDSDGYKYIKGVSEWYK